MSVVFNKERKRFIVDWRAANGKRKSQTLWRDATLKDAQSFFDRVREYAADPFCDLRKSLSSCLLHKPEHGRVYAINNELLPGMFKIGKTAGPVHERLKAFNTAHPVDWSVCRAVRVTHMSAFERALHNYFSSERVNPNREFFRLTGEQINAAFDLCVEIGDAEIRAADLAKKYGRTEDKLPPSGERDDK